MTVWEVADGVPVSTNDGFVLGPDLAAAHTYPPPGHVPGRAPQQCVTSRPVPRTFRDGLLIVPETLDREQPWSRLDLLVDVLRKRSDLSVPGPTPVWTLRAEGGQGHDTWVFTLECPLDWAWVLAHAVLPGNLRLVDGPSAPAPVVGDGSFFIVAPERPDAPRWVEAGWVQGKEFLGSFPLSPAATYDAEQERKRAVRRQRRADGRKWWQR